MTAFERAKPRDWGVLEGRIVGRNGSTIAEMNDRGPAFAEQDAVNAALIVAAVNSHEALVEALELILPMAKGYACEHRVGSNAEIIEQAEAVLTAARGEG